MYDSFFFLYNMKIFVVENLREMSYQTLIAENVTAKIKMELKTTFVVQFSFLRLIVFSAKAICMQELYLL